MRKPGADKYRTLLISELARTFEEATAIAAAAAPSRRQPTQWNGRNGLPSGRVPLESAPRLKELIRGYHRDLQAAADDPKRRVAWCSALGPCELVRALGITPYFPENHAALIGASRQAGRYISRAMAEGFSQFTNSAMTSDIGAMLERQSPLVSVYGIDGPPRPDVLVFSTNLGHRVVRWFEYYGTQYRVPVHGLHPPTALREVDRVEVDAAVQQTLRLLPALEKVALARLDIDRLAEVVGLSAHAASLWVVVDPSGRIWQGRDDRYGTAYRCHRQIAQESRCPTSAAEGPRIPACTPQRGTRSPAWCWRAAGPPAWAASTRGWSNRAVAR